MATTLDGPAGTEDLDHGSRPPPPRDPGPGDGGGGGSWRVVAEFPQVWEAELARGALEHTGVAAIVDASSLSDPYYPSFAAVGWATARVLVRARDFAEARALLDDIAAGES